MQMWAIAWYTCKEFLRKKIVYVVLFIAFLLLLSTVIAGSLALSEQGKIVQDMGLGVIEICGLIMTLFFGSHLLANEISQGTIFLLLSKNIKRSNIVVGKYVGFGIILFLLWLLLSIAFVGVMALYNQPWQELYVYALLGTFVSWLVTLALVVFFSTFVSPFVSLFVSIVVYLLGHMMSFVVYYVTVLKTDVFSPLFGQFVKVIYYVLPNYTALGVKEFLDVPTILQTVRMQFGGSVFISLIYIVLLLTFGALIFRKKEL